jgi:hypothetical protein
VGAGDTRAQALAILGSKRHPPAGFQAQQTGDMSAALSRTSCRTRPSLRLKRRDDEAHRVQPVPAPHASVGRDFLLVLERLSHSAAVPADRVARSGAGCGSAHRSEGRGSLRSGPGSSARGCRSISTLAGAWRFRRAPDPASRGCACLALTQPARPGRSTSGKVTTVVPLAEAPVRNVYLLSWEELNESTKATANMPNS